MPVNRRLLSLRLFPLALLLPAPVSAQVHWLELDGSGVAAEYRRIGGDETPDMELLSGALFVIGHFELSSGMQVIVELPLARAAFEGFEASTELGNPYLGVRRAPRAGAPGFDLGTRLPAMDDDFSSAAFVGLLSSLMEHTAAFSSETLPLIAGIGGVTSPSESAELRMRAGLVYFHYTGDADVDDAALAMFTGQAFYSPGRVRLGAGIDVRYSITGSGGTPGERSLIEGVLLGAYDFGRVATGVQLHLPLDEDYKEILGHILGVSVEVALE